MRERRFISLWGRCTASDSDTRGAEVYTDLKNRYSEGHRRYHTPVHIAHCLKLFDLARDKMDEPDAVEMSIWFHDVIYDARAQDNEEKSANYFIEVCADDVEQGFKSKVCDLIIVTMHTHLPDSNDEKYMVDIDLSSFGLPWARFLKDSKAVREEYRHLSDREFYPAQKKFLQSLVSRKHFCFTKFFRDRHEKTARENIERYLENLKEQGLV